MKPIDYDKKDLQQLINDKLPITQTKELFPWNKNGDYIEEGMICYTQDVQGIQKTYKVLKYCPEDTFDPEFIAPQRITEPKDDWDRIFGRRCTAVYQICGRRNKDGLFLWDGSLDENNPSYIYAKVEDTDFIDIINQHGPGFPCHHFLKCEVQEDQYMVNGRLIKLTSILKVHKCFAEWDGMAFVR